MAGEAKLNMQAMGMREHNDGDMRGDVTKQPIELESREVKTCVT